MRVFLRVFLRVSFGRDEISAARARGDGDARSAPPGRAPRRRCLRTARCASSPRRQRPRSGARDLRRRDSGFETNDESAREREKMDVVAERARGGFETRGQRARRRETPRVRLRGDQRARGRPRRAFRRSRSRRGREGDLADAFQNLLVCDGGRAKKKIRALTLLREDGDASLGELGADDRGGAHGGAAGRDASARGEDHGGSGDGGHGGR